MRHRTPPGRVPGRRGARPPCRPGFTLMELLIVVAIIGLLATLAFVVLSRSLSDARRSVERQTLIGVRNGVESFRQEFGFLPPLVNDTNPYNAPTGTPNVRSDAFLASEVETIAPRWSIFSVPYYVIGMLPAEADGVDGPGFTEPQRDGTFSKRGRSYPSRLDISADPSRLKRHGRDPEKVAYVDRWGRNVTNVAGWPAVNPIRYYRWKPGFDANGQVSQYLVPRAVGDPNVDISLRDAEYAIVSVGPDGLTDERRPLPTNGVSDGRTDSNPVLTRWTSDDIVEVGK